MKTTSKLKMTSKIKTTSKMKMTSKDVGGGGLSSQTMFPAPGTSKSCQWYSSIANWNYSWSGRVGWSNSDYKAISASQQSWSLGLAELGNI